MRGKLTDQQNADVLTYVKTMFDKRNEYLHKVKGTSLRFGTIDDLLATYYPSTDAMYLSWLKKADDPMLSDSSGFANIVYGAQLYQTQDLSHNVYDIIPHAPWDVSGWNYAVARHATGGGQTEGAVLPDTDKQDPEKYSNTPKEIIHTYEASLKAILLARTGDDNIPPLESERPLIEEEHKRDMESYLMQDCNTLAGVNLESLDRLTATTAAQVTALGYDAGDEDIFNIDKSASTDLDPLVIHNSGTDRDFSFDYLDTALAATRRYRSGKLAGGQLVIITGPNMVERMSEEEGAKQRFQNSNPSKWAGGFRGLRNVDGLSNEGGFGLASYREIPIVETTAASTDTLERIYGIYLSPKVGSFFKDLLPTTLFSSSDYMDLDGFKQKEALLTIGEIACFNPRSNFQLRDFQ